jgi:hypothetical protein
VVEEIIGRLPELSGAQISLLEDEIRRERQRRASSEGGGEGAPQIHKDTAPHGSPGVQKLTATVPQQGWYKAERSGQQTLPERAITA